MLTNKEKEDLAKDVSSCVKDVVKRELPIALVEELAPMVRKTSDAVLKRYKRFATLGFILGALAIGLMVWQLKAQADRNTKINHKQDCVLVGLIVGIQGSDHDKFRNGLYDQAISSLTSPDRCNLSVPHTHP